MPRIPRIRKTSFPDPMFMNRSGRLSRLDLFPDEFDSIYPEYVPVQGPDLPYKLEERRQWVRDAQDAYEADLAEERARQAYNRNIAAWNSYRELPYRDRLTDLDAIAQERARQAYNQKLIEEAVRLRKEELWRQYMEEEDPPPGIGWPTGKGEELDEGFEEQARWDVQGMVNPNDNFWGITDDEFREKYKDAPWRLW